MIDFQSVVTDFRNLFLSRFPQLNRGPIEHAITGLKLRKKQVVTAFRFVTNRDESPQRLQEVKFDTPVVTDIVVPRQVGIYMRHHSGAQQALFVDEQYFCLLPRWRRIAIT